MNYREAVHYLYSLGNEVQTAKLGLDRIRALLARLGNPHLAYRTVHAAGTNGKGSTCAMIEAGLRAAGLRTGLYTSPHLTEPTERIRIAGREASQAQFVAAFARVQNAAQAMLASGELEFHPTYFETVTTMAFVLFRDENIDIAVIETGLGGRLDATNVVRPEVCVITPIDYDHQDLLGPTIEKIAAEKAGILKPEAIAVIAKQRPEARAVLLAHADELGVPLVFTSDWTLSSVDLRAEGSTLHTAAGLTLECPLAGAHQVENALAAAIALDLLHVPPQGIAQAHWPARLEIVHRAPTILLDGAHNPAGAQVLAAHLRQFYADKPLTLVFAAMRDKPIAEIAEILFPLAETILATQVDNARAMAAGQIRRLAPDRTRVAVIPTVAETVARALASPPGATIVFAGSLYLAGAARPLLTAHTPSG
jgi:dihydrofolate synthase/folylpolyglutamate synthase